MPLYRRPFSFHAALTGIVLVSTGVMASLTAPVVAQTPAPPQATGTTTSPGQTEEMVRLRPYLWATPDTKIQPAAAAKLSANFPIKVFISTGLDMTSRDNYVRWINEWQKKDAKKTGPIELVSDATKADVILVRYTLIDHAAQQVKTESYPIVTQTDYDRHDVVENSHSYGTKSSYSTGERSVSTTMVPTYTYIAERQGADFQILTREEALIPADETKNVGQPLWETFKKLLKQRADDIKKK